MQNTKQTKEEMNEELNKLLNRQNKAWRNRLINGSKKYGYLIPDTDIRAYRMGSTIQLIQNDEIVGRNEMGLYDVTIKDELVSLSKNDLLRLIPFEDKNSIRNLQLKVYNDEIEKINIPEIDIETETVSPSGRFVSKEVVGRGGSHNRNKELAIEYLGPHYYASLLIYRTYGVKVPISKITFINGYSGGYNGYYNKNDGLPNNITLGKVRIDSFIFHTIDMIVGKDINDEFVSIHTYNLLKNADTLDNNLRNRYSLFNSSSHISCAKFEVDSKNPPGCITMVGENDILFEVKVVGTLNIKKEDEMYLVSLNAILDKRAVLIIAKRHEMLKYLVPMNGPISVDEKDLTF